MLLLTSGSLQEIRDASDVSRLTGKQIASCIFEAEWCYIWVAHEREVPIMQTLRGNMEGPLTIETDTVLRGNVSGDVIVRSGCQLELRGNLMGDIILGHVDKGQPQRN
ncbi:hypothetical protein NI18_02595 [Sphingomonas sp. Ant20]|nr:hypothetical protein NI18_02595 [Sphingomonas sp. Ant20]